MIVTRRHWIVTVLGGVTATFTGCGDSPAPPPTNTEERPLRLLVIDSPEMAAQIERHWRAQSDAPFELTQATSKAAQAFKRLPVDVVLYPSELLGTFAEAEWIVPLSTDLLDSDDFKRRDLLPQARSTEVLWGTNTLAVSLGSPNFNLYYRTDLFDRLGLKPPTTWAEYTAVATALSKHDALGDAVAGEANWSAVLEPLAPGSAGLTLLARAAAYVRHRSEYAALFHLETMEPLVDHPPFVRALEELVTVAKLGRQASGTITPSAAREAIYAGRCGIAWTWPTAAGSAIANSPAAPTIAIAELPGASDVYNFR
ncbi:MAG TPA: extracellular solute-binding protein, partial [Pirellulaceae bacterium]|nr:extracellular solute-binding protein [Pirellulaceae bacterium]